MLSQRVVLNGLFLLGAGCSLGHASTLVVGGANSGCSDATYTTINAALTAAKAGDEIKVCPGLYAEQLVISKPVKLRGVDANGINRVLIQPTSMTTVTNMGASFQAVISIVNTTGVEIKGLAIDASNNSVTGCAVTLSVIHFSNSSGEVEGNALSGAQLSNPLTCLALFPGNGFGVLVDETAGNAGPFSVEICGNVIHDFNRNGILAKGAGITVEVEDNTISGVGPSTGYNQFAVFVALGTVAKVRNNNLSQGNCGTVDIVTCFNLRSEGVVFRGAGDGSEIESNVITNVQSGIFINGGNKYKIAHNVISNVDALEGIHIQGTATGYFTNSVIEENTISHVFPIIDAVETCGIGEVPSSGVAQNIIRNNRVNDSYCGVGYVMADQVIGGRYLNTLYATINGDNYVNIPGPPAVEP